MTDYDVTIRNVTKRFGSLTAVAGLDLDVPRGHFVALLGPSGCGKTTTLRMIGGFEHPDSGDIAIRGESMGTRPPHQRHTSMVFQSYALFPHMSVADNIGFGLRERKMSPARIDERVQQMLTLVELPDYGARRPRQLSGGQQQRVALARSLVIEPTVLLLDEPLGALDLRLRNQMQVELKHIQQRVGITFVYVTHDQEEALTMSDTIVVMNNGRVEQQGSAEEIFEQPRTRFVATFMGAQILANTGIAGGDATSTRLRIGPHEITVPKALPSGAREITIVARPGKIRLNSPNGWPATVTDRVYKGAVITYQLALGDGTPITADVAHDMPGHRHAVGDAVTIGIRPEDLVIIPEPLQSA